MHELLEIVLAFAEAVACLRGAGERVEAVWLLLDGCFEMRFESQADLDVHSTSPATKRLHDDGATFIGREIDFETRKRSSSREPDARGPLALRTNWVSWDPGDTPALPERSHSGSAFRPSADSWRP
jgi:hypothetical protein